jgi:hypothetical protein
LAFSGFEVIASPPPSPSSAGSSAVVSSVAGDSASVDSDEVLESPPPQAEIPTASASAAISITNAINGFF